MAGLLNRENISAFSEAVVDYRLYIFVKEIWCGRGLRFAGPWLGWLDWRIIKNMLTLSEAVVAYSLYDFGRGDLFWKEFPLWEALAGWLRKKVDPQTLYSWRPSGWI